MNFKRHIALAVLAVLAATPSALARQLPVSEEMEAQIKEFRKKMRETEALRLALLGVLSERDAPGGMVIYPECGEEERVPRPTAARLTGAPLAEALDALAAAAPRYLWRSEGGVVNFFPAGTHTPLLDLRVERFRAENMRTPGEALGRLLDTPEVREAIGRPEVGDRLLRGGLGYYDPNREESAGKVFSVSLGGATVREALDAIARAHGRAMWSYHWINCSGRSHFEVDFLEW